MLLKMTLLYLLPLLTSVQGGSRVIKTAVELHHKKTTKRREVLGSFYPRSIPSYSVVSSSAYYHYGTGAHLTPFARGSYYNGEAECDRRGEDCWGFQSTWGCEDRLGCTQALILSDPGDTPKAKIAGTTVFSKMTQTWDPVPVQCEGLTQDWGADTVGRCEYNCASDRECEIYQWYEDNTCFRGKSDQCRHTNRHVEEGFRRRPVRWTTTKSRCDGLKYDPTAKGDQWTCRTNCYWDLTCSVYQFDGETCKRGHASQCHKGRDESIGEKNYKFVWKPLMSVCDGFDRDQNGDGNADICQSNCASDDNCSAWQIKANGECWRGQPDRCFGNSGKVKNGGYRWYVSNHEPVTCPIEYNIDYYGNDISWFTTESVAECQKECYDDSECKYFTWTPEKMCHLKTSDAGRREGTNMYSGASCNSCPIYHNLDYFGNDIDKFTTDSVAECQKACYVNGECQYFTLTPNNECFLKTSDAGRREGANMYSGASCNSNPIYQNLDYFGNDIDMLTTASVAECQRACYFNIECNYFTFTPPNHRCHLKTSDAGRRQSTNTYSGSAPFATATCNGRETLGWTDGDFIRAFQPHEAPNGIKFRWEECAQECWKNSECTFWTLQLDGRGECHLKNNKGAYHASELHMEGNKDSACASIPQRLGDQRSRLL